MTRISGVETVPTIQLTSTSSRLSTAKTATSAPIERPATVRRFSRDMRPFPRPRSGAVAFAALSTSDMRRTMARRSDPDVAALRVVAPLLRGGDGERLPAGTVALREAQLGRAEPAA